MIKTTPKELLGLSFIELAALERTGRLAEIIGANRMSADAWTSLQHNVIDAVERAKSAVLAAGEYNHSYGIGYAHAKRDVLVELTKVMAAMDDGMRTTVLYAQRYAWLRDGNGYAPEENYARGGEDLDRVCDEGIKEDASAT